MSYEWDNKKPTAQMLGRWQPFHDGHYALFEEIIKKTGQVCIQIRDVQGVDDNPFDFETVKKNIEEGRGWRLMGAVGNKGGIFDFASSHPLWQATLDTIDFMPLVSANYSGGIIITDWYSENNSNQSIKINIVGVYWHAVVFWLAHWP